MKSLRRYYIPNATYFLSVVTYRREPILLRHPDLFWYAWDRERPDAWIIFPDHFHILIRPVEENISQLMQRFKLRYARQYLKHHESLRVWQHRFWDRIIRNETEYNRCLYYIHNNPVHHKYVANPVAWEFSSLAVWIDNGHFELAFEAEGDDAPELEFGEPKENVG